MLPPGGFDAQRWVVGVCWARWIAVDYGLLTFANGWEAVELFGLHPVAPATRYDSMGLAFLLRRSTQILQLNRERAVIRDRSSDQGSERRRDHVLYQAALQ
jgi:hypothetical protein